MCYKSPFCFYADRLKFEQKRRVYLVTWAPVYMKIPLEVDDVI